MPFFNFYLYESWQQIMKNRDNYDLVNNLLPRTFLLDFFFKEFLSKFSIYFPILNDDVHMGEW